MNNIKSKDITNPLYKTLLKLKLVKLSNLEIVSNYVRDSSRKNNVYFDKSNHFYFLQKSIYSEEFNYDLLFKDNPVNNKFILKNKNNNLKLNIIDDDHRRFNQFKKILKNKSILDFGSGYGNFISKFNRLKVSAIEKREKCINYLKHKKIKVYGNLEEVDKKFDFITLFNSIDHLDNPDEILRKLKRFLNKNGKLIIEVPNANNILLNSEINEYKSHTFCKKHLIIFSEKVLLKVLEASGFKIKNTLYYQRYNFKNHLYWYLFKKPNGHNLFKNLKLKKVDINYNKFLVDTKQTDTIIIIAQKK